MSLYVPHPTMGIVMIRNTGIIMAAKLMHNAASKHIPIIFKASLSFVMAVTRDRVAELKEIGISLAKEKINITPYLSAFDQKYENKNSKSGIVTRRRLPTQKQWLYVKYLFEGFPRMECYRKAGYKMPKQRYLRTMTDIIHNHRVVQILISLVISEYTRKREVSSQALLDKALGLYDRCDTVREQLDVLKFINSLLPKGYTARCHRVDCPLKKKK